MRERLIKKLDDADLFLRNRANAKPDPLNKYDISILKDIAKTCDEAARMIEKAIVPPCKVGDKAYIIEKDNKIMRTNVIGVKVGHLGLYIMLEKDEEWFYIRECEIGKTLFFAEKEAFAKLKEGAE